MNEEYLTVTEITKYLENKFKRDSNLRNIYISGEISNYVVYPKIGIAYFTLKDKKSKIPAVLFLRVRNLIKFTPENGMNVLIKGSVEVYSKNGAYRLKVNNMKEDGLGELHVAFEQLKKKLEKEGYFDKNHKKEIPRFPKRIGVITAKTGAALRDIITTIKRRWPICEILLLPSYVQGENAKKDLVRQIKNAENYNLDTLIIGRGGGSIEDLWAFNEEIVTKAIYNCPIPTISAVGHETDSTISDYTADLRAPTPTAAGELAVPELNEMENKVSILFKKAFNSINHKIMYNSEKFSYITKKECLNNPKRLLNEKKLRFNSIKGNLNYISENIIISNKNKLNQLKTSLKYNNPQKTITDKNKQLKILKHQLINENTLLVKENKSRLINIKKDLLYNSSKIITSDKNMLNQQKTLLKYNNPQKIIKEKDNTLKEFKKQIIIGNKNIVTSNKNKLNQLKTSLKYNNPQKIVKKRKENLNELKLRLNHVENMISTKKEQEREIRKNKTIIIGLVALTIILIIIILILLSTH